MPPIGATSAASRRPTRVVSSAATAAACNARALSSCEREVSSAIAEMNDCWARRSFDACVRSACASAALAASALAWRSLLRLCNSARSMRPSDWPALTCEPSCTASPTSVPPALARTTAVSGATSGPENSMLPGIVVHAGCTTSRGANSSVTAALSSFFLAWL